MELINAARLAQLSGLGAPTISRYMKAGKIPTCEDSNGRIRFDPQAALLAIKSLGIKPRMRSAQDESGADESPPPKQKSKPRPASTEPPPDRERIMNAAMGAAESAFVASIIAALPSVRESGDDALELELSRVALGSAELFAEVKTLFSSDD